MWFMTGRFVPRHKEDENDRHRTARAMPIRREPADRTTRTNIRSEMIERAKTDADRASFTDETRDGLRV